MTDFYEEFENDKPAVERAKKKSELKRFYYDFFKDFREFLAEYNRESIIGLQIAEIKISKRPVILFSQESGIKIQLKNQGPIACFVTTGKRGGYRLDPGERVDFWANEQVLATTLSGETTLGIIRT